MKFGQSNSVWTRVTDICNRAFQMWRGAYQGDAITDWLEAERELLEKSLSSSDQPDRSAEQELIEPISRST